MRYAAGDSPRGAPSRTGPPDKLPRLAVWAATILMAFWALAFTGKYASQVPYGDDWNHIEVLAGAKPASVEWIWELDYGYRHVLSRVSFVVLGWLSGGDQRAPRFASAVLLVVSAIVIVTAARRARGYARYTDIVFPLALLHWGHTRPLLQNHYLYSAFFALLLLVILRAVSILPAVPRSRTVGTVGLCLIALPLTGAIGVAAAPPLIAWLAWMGIADLRRGKEKTGRAGAAAVVFAAVATGVLSLYLVGYRTPPDSPPSPGPLATLTCAVQFLSMGFGPGARSIWPFAGATALLLGLTSTALLARRWFTHPEERPRTAGFLLLLCSMALLAIAVGFGRAGYNPDRDPAGLRDQYATAAVPFLLVLYMAWDASPGGRGERIVRALLAAVVLVLLPFNSRHGVGVANSLKEIEAGLVRDIDAGLSSREIAGRHWPAFYGSEGKMARLLELMRRTGFGPFRDGAAARR